MATTAAIKLIPKRKLGLLYADGGDSTIEHIAQIAEEQTVNNFDWNVQGTEPHIRLSEIDQVDPAGRFQLRVVDGDFGIEKALTANWASVTKLLYFDTSANATEIYNVGSSAGFLQLGGAIATDYAARLILYGSTASGNVGAMVFQTPNDALSAEVTRLAISGDSDSAATITVSQASLIFGTNGKFKCNAVTGDGSANMSIAPNSASTETERTLTLKVIDNGVGFLDMISLIPNATAPTMDFNSRPIANITPSTTGGSSVKASYGPAAVTSITVVNGLITAIS